MTRLLVTDMDGTFLTHEGTYDRQGLAHLLDRLDQLGMTFVVASGRSYLTLSALFEGFLDRIAIIAENGGLVVVKGQVLSETQMSPDLYLDIVSALEQTRDCQGYLLSGRQGSYAPLTASQTYLDHEKQYYDGLVRADLTELTDTIYKVTAQFSEELILQRVADLTQRIEGVTAVATGFDGMDIIPSQVNKGVGLTQLCQKLGVDLSEVVAFGDNHNDLEMLTLAGRAIATENAREDIKALADQVIGSCQEGAVLTYMRGLVDDRD